MVVKESRNSNDRSKNKKKDRFIFTNDSDFLEVENHLVILYISLKSAYTGEIIKEVVSHVNQYLKEDFLDTIFYFIYTHAKYLDMNGKKF